MLPAFATWESMGTSRNVAFWKNKRSTMRRLFPVLLFLVTTVNYGCCSGDADSVTTFTFLDEGEDTSPRPVPINLGQYPFDCLGNLEHCPDGFTLRFWLHVTPGNPEVPHHYLVSSGGQTHLSEGWYFRQNYGKEYEAGVALGDRVWTASFDLESGKSVWLAMVWDPRALKVYVDGLLAATDTEGTSRVFSPSVIDLFPNIVIGRANDELWLDQSGVDIPDVQMGYLKHWALAMSADDTFEGTGSSYILGCALTFPDGQDQPTGTSDATTDPTTISSVRACRQFCTDRARPVSFLRKQELCACWDDSADLKQVMTEEGDDKQCPESIWSIYSSGSLTPSTIYPIGLKVHMVKPTENDYIRPGETVVFEMTTMSDEDVTYVLSFDDGATVMTPSGRVAHEWTKEGSYVISVSASSRLAEQTLYVQVDIEQVEEGWPPGAVDIQGSTLQTESRQVQIFLDAFSVAAMNCELYYGDGKTSTYPEVIDLLEASKAHTYATIGFYVVELDCKNMFGSSNDSHTVVAAYPTVEYENRDRSLDISIPVVAADVEVNSLLVLVDNQVTEAVLEAAHVTLPHDTFEHSGEHIVTLKTPNQPVYTKVYNLLDAVSDVEIYSNVTACQVDQDIELTFKVTGGDFIYLHMDMGDGMDESWFFPQAPDPLPQVHSYPELGVYTVSLTAANDISYKTVEKNIYVERLLRSVSMAATHVKTLGDPTVFTLWVDMDRSPAMPVEVEFDYGDGVLEVVTLGGKQPKPTALTHEHVYQDYGMYEVYIIVKNHISFLDDFVDVQVGEHIELVDVSVEEPRVVAGQQVALTVVCPHGSPVELQLDMDDGYTVVVDWPHGGTTVVRSDSLVSIHDNDNPSEGSGDADDQVLALDRKRRSLVVTTNNGTRSESADRSSEGELSDVAVEEIADGLGGVDLEDMIFEEKEDRKKLDSSIEVSQVFSLEQEAFAPNDDFLIKYTYTEAGVHTVSVKAINTFSTRETELCPDIVVVAPELAIPPCSDLSVEIADSTSLVVMRSEPIKLSAVGTFTCTDGGGATYEARYTWTGQRQTKDQGWRPELEICECEDIDPDFTIPPRSLWYGIYRITVAISLDEVTSDSSAQRRRRASPGSIPTVLTVQSLESYLEVVPTDLVADIKGGDARDLVSTSVVSFDLSASNDPDVTANNKSGMNFYLFCYSEAAGAFMAGRPLDDHLAATSMVCINSANTSALYGDGDCFEDRSDIWMSGYSAVMPGDVLNMNGSLVLHLIVTKDDRVASYEQTVTVWPTNMTGNALMNIDDLLASGNTDGALMVLDLVTNSLTGDSNDTAGMTETRSLIINALDKVAQQIVNVDQAKKATGVLSTVTEVGDQLTPDSKATAAGAADQAAKTVEGMADSATLGDLSNIADNVLGAVANVLPGKSGSSAGLPAGEDSDDSSGDYDATEAPLEYEDYDPVETTEAPPVDETKVVLVPCCVIFDGLCEWLEPEEDPEYIGLCRPDTLNDGCFVLGDGTGSKFKDTVWTEKVCMEEHPDNVRDDVLPNFQCHKDLIKQREYAVAKKTTTSGMGGVGKVSNGLQKKELGAEGITLGTPQLKLTVAKMSANETRRRRRRRGVEPDVNLGGFKVPLGSLSDAGDVGAQVVQSKDNPFTYSDGPQVKTGVQSLTFKDGSGNEIPVENTDEPFVMRFPGPFGGPPVTFTYSPNGRGMLYHPLVVKEPNKTAVLFLKPLNQYDIYTIYLGLEYQPNNSMHLMKVDLPDPNRMAAYNSQANIPKEWPYMFVVDPEYTQQNGTYQVGVEVKKTLSSLKDKSNVRQREYTYNYVATDRVCRYWDDVSDEWASDGCWVSSDSTLHETVCNCNHLTSFGGDFAVPPNTINFKTVFSAAKFVESLPVSATVLIILALYVVGMVWARRMDKKDLIKWGAAPLEDNLPTDTYHYQLTVYTGVRKNAGTGSRISFIMSGDDADSGVRRLADGKRKTLPTGSIYNYVLSTEYCMGALTYLRIWHDNSGNGKQKGWFLDQIHATDLQSGEKFFFLCDRWLAVEEDDGMVERIIPVAGNDDLTAFKNLFSSSVRKKLSNDHMWVSVFSRPTKSNFTRVQRVSCCMCLLFLTMISNCMFFKADENAAKTSALTIGPISFTLHQLFISVVCTAIVFPPSIIIVSIFRKAKPKKNTVMQSNQHLSQRSKKYRWRTINPGSSLWTNVEVSKMDRVKERMRSIFTFRKKAKKYRTDPQDQTGTKKKKKKAFMLPHWTMYIAWILVFFSIVASGFFTILYSMEWGREKSIDWLTTFVMSFFQSVVVVQPVKVLLLAAFLSCVMRKPDIDDEEGEFNEAHSDESPDKNRPTSARDIELLTNSQRDLQALIEQRKMAATTVAPPDFESLEAARQLRKQEMQMEAILKECIIYFFFLIVLFFLSYQARDPASFRFSTNIKNTFAYNSPSLDSVTSNPLFWRYAHDTLLPNLYSSNWYNGKELDWRESLQMDDRATIRVGVARLRQLRIKDDTCSIQSYFTDMINHCTDSYNFHDDDTKDYLPGWVRPDTEELEDRAEHCHEKQSPWSYRSSVELKNAPYSGKVIMYKGGGYTFTFKRDVAQTKKLLTLLEEQFWLDMRTRAIFVEFTLYNANANLFGSVILLVEALPTGGSISKSDVKVFRVSSYVGGFGIIVIIFELIFLVFTLYFLAKLANDLRKQRLKYFKDLWNLLEFTMVGLCITSIVMYAMKKVFSTVAMHVLHDSGSADYVNFVTISIWDELFGVILACAVFFATIKFVKMLKFNKRMSMLGDTIQVATKDMKNFSIVFFVYFMAFCMAFYVLFGMELPSYGSFAGTIESLFAFALGDFDFYELADSQRILGPFFFFAFVGVIYIGLMGMFLTIINESFALVKANSEERSNEYEIVDFIWGKFKGVFGW